MEVRRAVAEDAPAIASVVVEAWNAAYRGSIPDEVIDRLTVDVRTEQWSEAIAAGRVVFVSVDEGRVCGFCSTAVDDADPGISEVTAIYVAPGSAGRGHGTALLQAACDSMRSAGMQGAILWVLASNRDARGFYERAGWEPVGGERVDESFGTPLHLVGYRTSL